MGIFEEWPRMTLFGDVQKWPIAELPKMGVFPEPIFAAETSLRSFDQWHLCWGRLASSLSRLSKALLSPIWGYLMPGFVDATISLRP